MKRLIKFDCGTIDKLNAKKYVLTQEYEGFGIYEEVCPSGYRVHQSWLIANDKNALVCESYNNFCKEELLDMIDNYNQKSNFGTKGFLKGFYSNLNVYVAHNSYSRIV